MDEFHYLAQYTLGNCYKFLLQEYKNGSSTVEQIEDTLKQIEETRKQVIKCYTLSAEQGFSKAQLKLTEYLNNKVESFKWTLKAADQYDKVAQYLLGNAYEQGMGCEQNNQKALKYFNLSANQGYVDSLFRLGKIYARGELGETKDHSKAIKYMTPIANLTLIEYRNIIFEAQGALSVIYLKNYQEFQDHTEGLKWLKKAADNGFLQSMYKLAEAYEKGLYLILIDIPLAIKWYKKAADKGYKNAIEALKRLDNAT